MQYDIFMSPFITPELALVATNSPREPPVRFNSETAALAFLQKLTALGYAEFALDEGEFITQHGYETSPVDDGNICRISLDNKALTYWISLHSSGIVCVVKGGVRSLAERRKQP